MLKVGLGIVAGAILGFASHALLTSGDKEIGAANAEVSGEAPAYMVVLGEVYDRDAFMSGYVAKLAPIYETYGGEYISLGGAHEVLEGETGFQSHVITKWPGGMEDARAFWNSPEYDALKQLRIDNNWGRFDVFLVEGLPAQNENL